MYRVSRASLTLATVLCFGTVTQADPLLQFLFDTNTPLKNSGTSGAANDLTLLGTAVVSQQVRPGGNTGGVLDNTASTWRSFTDAGAASAGTITETPSMTFTLWFKPIGTLSGLDFTHLLCNVPNGGNNSGGFQIFYHNNGNQVATGRSGTNAFVNPVDALGSAYAVNSSNWHFIAATFSDTERQIFVGNAANNAMVANTVVGNFSLSDVVHQMIIGNRVDSNGLANDRPFDGYLFDVRAYTSVLTVEEIDAVRNSIIPEPAMMSIIGLGSVLLLRRRVARQSQ